MLNEPSWWRAMPIGLSCLLHVGLVTGLIVGQQWVTSVVALQSPVLPVRLVTLDAAEPPRELAPPATPRRERAAPIRRPEPTKAREIAAAKVEEPAPQPVAPAPADIGPAPTGAPATLPAISEPAPAPGPSAPASSGTTVALPPSAPIVASNPATTAPDAVTQTARPLALVLAASTTTQAAELTLGPRLEYKHVSRGREFHLSGTTVTAGPDGRPLVAGAAQEGHANQLYVLQVGDHMDGRAAPVRVNPEALTVEALHHPPRLAVAAGGPVYVSWSSGKPKPEGTLFASDLQLSRSLDGGRRFEPPLRVNADRPISHSFDGLAVAADGTVLLTWIDGHEGPKDPATWVARVAEQGTRVEGIRKVGDDTCVCCRVDAAAGAGNTVALTWRRVFPGDIRDMVLAVSRDGGRTFGDATLVSADHWKINACPHRGVRWARTRRVAST